MAEILIVEDEELINNLIKENLVLAGHTCTQVYNGQTALETIHSHTFDLILLDIMLPGCSDMIFCRNAKISRLLY